MAREPTRSTALILVGAGGFLGAVLRHLVTVAMPTAALGTLVVNVVGSFALGIALSESRLAGRLSARIRLFLATGVISSFTTYSTFALEVTQLAPMWAAAFVGANYGLAILAVVLAHVLARWWS